MILQKQEDPNVFKCIQDWTPWNGCTATCGEPAPQGALRALPVSQLELHGAPIAGLQGLSTQRKESSDRFGRC